MYIGRNNTVASYFTSKKSQKKSCWKSWCKIFWKQSLRHWKEKHKERPASLADPACCAIYAKKTHLNQIPPAKLLVLYVVDMGALTKIASLAPWAFAADSSWGCLRTPEAVLWQFKCEDWRIPWKQLLETVCASRSAFSYLCILPLEVNKTTTPLHSIV